MLDVEFHLRTETAVALLFKPYYFVVLLKEPVITVFYKVRCTGIFKRCSEGMFSIRENIICGVSPCDCNQVLKSLDFISPAVFDQTPSIHH